MRDKEGRMTGSRSLQRLGQFDPFSVLGGRKLVDGVDSLNLVQIEPANEDDTAFGILQEACSDYVG